MAKKKTIPLTWAVTGMKDDAVHTLTVNDLHTSIEVRIGGDSGRYPWIAVEDGVPWFERRWSTSDKAKKDVEDTVTMVIRSR